MKYIIFILFILCSVSIFAQERKMRDKSLPVTFTQHSLNIQLKGIEDVPTVSLPEVNTDSLVEISESSEQFAIGIDVDIDIMEIGSWDTLETGDRLLRLKVVSKGAKIMSFIFSKFKVPENGKLWIYNTSGRYRIGPFTAMNNKAHGRFSASFFDGDTAIFEYFEPVGQNNKGEMKLERIFHGFRNVLQKEFVKQGKRNNTEMLQGPPENLSEDINCAIGQPYCKEKHSVCMINNYHNGTWRIGEGALINNLNNPIRNFIITAWNTIDSDKDYVISQDEIDDCVDYEIEFGYYELECESANPTMNQTIAEVEKSGINVGEIQGKLLQKIEEMTLYLIDMKKENELLKQRIENLEANK